MAASAALALGDVRLAPVFGDHMVLQQDAVVTIWGYADPGEGVSVKPTWNMQEHKTTADDQGRWQVVVRTPQASTTPKPRVIWVVGKNTIKVDDVLIGDVWLASGQSNMEWPLRATGDQATPSGPAQAMVRVCNIKNTLSVTPRLDTPTEFGWSTLTPDIAANYSAIAQHFATAVHAEVGIPIGIIEADWGGTPAQAWIPAHGLAGMPEYKAALEYLAALSPDPNERERNLAAFADRWWDALDGRSDSPGSEWASDAFDDAGWRSMTLPATMQDDGLDRFDGLVYFRRTIDLPEALAGKAGTLELGPIDDRDDAYVNGTRIGSTREDGQWSRPRVYAVPPGVLRAGKNTIGVRLLDTAGPGGINGRSDQMALRVGDASVPLSGAWKYVRGPSKGDLPPIGEPMAINAHTPTVLYNGMIRPLRGLPLAGFLWYQGESNRGDGERYTTLMKALIASWRAEQGGRETPFYFVQIAPFNYGNDRGETAELRDAQTRVLDSVPGTGMVVTMDIGDERDIHPKNKREVGQRLARLALHRHYGKQGIVSSGPRFKSLSAADGSLTVTFDLQGSRGLAKGEDIKGFAVAGEDRVFHAATAGVTGTDTVLVRAEGVPSPVAVRYGWCNACVPTLMNAEGLPAVPFRSDAWERPAGGWLPPEQGTKTSHLTSEPGFVPLFNGKDLSGWVNVNAAPDTFVASDGMIRCTGKPTSVLRTARQYQNFVLELEWRHLEQQGNAGLFVWSDALPARGVPFTRSVEVQVMTGAEADWYTSDGDVFPIHGAVMKPGNPRPNGGSRSYPTEKRMKPSPEWNHYRVTCKDGSISLAVNGKVVTTGTDVSPRKGYICLEAEGSWIDFRNLMIKELPGGEIPADQAATPDEGFVPLFNGRDFSGWKFGPEHEGHFTVQDWSIAFDGKGKDLWTEESYKDFVLIADWRWTSKPGEQDRPVILPSGESRVGADGAPVLARVQDAGDSGIYLRGNSKSQVNMWCWPIGSGEVYGYRTDASMPAEVRAGVTPKVPADAPIGQWNRFVITMRGDRLTVVLNGKTVLEEARLPGVPAEGPIALQQHDGAVQFGNLYIKKLD